MYTVEGMRSNIQNLTDDVEVTLDAANAFFAELLNKVPHAKGINNKFFMEILDPAKPAPSEANLHIILQNWLEQKRILRRSLVQGLEATVVSEYWQGQMAYLDLLRDEIEGRHVNLAFESLKQIALVAGIDLPHSVDSQNSPLITEEMKALRSWQAESLRKDLLILIAVAIFERQSQPVLRRTYQALNAWYGNKLNEEQRKSFDRYFAVHTSIRDITSQSTFTDIVINIPKNSGVEEKHAEITGGCYVAAKQHITIKDLKSALEIFDVVNEMQFNAWSSVYNKIQ